MYDVCTDNGVASHDAPHHDAHSWRGHVHNRAARMHACEATDREREEWRRRPGRARGEGEPSRSRLEIARENKERGAPELSPLSLFLSLARPSRRFQLLRRDSLLARRNFFSRSKASRGNTPSRSNSFSERAKRRVKINYKCFLVAIFMRRRISDVFAMKIATICVVRGEYHGDRKLSIYRSVYRIRRDSIVCLI